MAQGTDFLPFAINVGANVESQAAYLASGHQINGFTAGVAQSIQFNKVWRQSSVVSAALANFITKVLNQYVSDNGDLTGLIALLWQAQMAGSYFSDTGSTNHLSIAAPAGLSFLAPFTGLTIQVRVGNTNTSTTVDLNYMGHGAVSITSMDGSALHIGDLEESAIVQLAFDGTKWLYQTPSPQAIKAISSITPVQSYTSAGAFSWTVPAGVYLVRKLTGIGGGGGGGFGANTTDGVASGGSAGATGIAVGIPVTPGSSITGTVGAGGAGSSTSSSGGNGGSTTITIGSTTYTAPGGPGGLSSLTGAANSPSLASFPTNFDSATSFYGSQGFFGFTTNSGVTTYSGQGGFATLGGTGGVGGGGEPGNGNSPGGGGGGSGSGFTGGNGAAGAVYIEY